MWDIVWTDPDRQLVGERRAQKAMSRQKPKEDDGASLQTNTSHRVTASRLSRTSPSVASGGSSFSASSAVRPLTPSANASSDSPLSSLVPKSLRRLGLRREKSGPFSEMPFSSDTSARSTNSPRPVSSTQSAEISDTAGDGNSCEQTRDDSLLSGGDLSPSSTSYHDSIFSKYPDSDAFTANSLHDSSSAEHRRTSSSAQRASTCFVSEPNTSTILTSPNDCIIGPQDTAADGLKVFAVCEKPITSPPGLSLLQLPPLPATPLAEVPAPLTPPLKSPLRNLSQRLSKPPSVFYNPDDWKPMGAWDTPVLPSPNAQPLTIDSLTRELTDAAAVAAKDAATAMAALELASLRREVERMSIASPEVVLSRLSEVWNADLSSDLSIELSMERKRWMLSALHHLDAIRGAAPAKVPVSVLSAQERVLIVQETACSASYLAALHHDKQVYHIAAHPLSPTKFPNVIPILSTPSTPFPELSAGMFDQVYLALALPVELPPAEVPALLAKVSKCLRSGGKVRIFLVDPLPRATTLGAHLRTWLETHLLANLGCESRSVTPLTAFPAWLADAGLRSKGSTLTSSKFFAALESSQRGPAFTPASPVAASFAGSNPDWASILSGEDFHPDPTIQATQRDHFNKAQLRSIVGRMLWQEAWGPYISPAAGRTKHNGEKQPAADGKAAQAKMKWWWENSRCVKECLQLGTFWEYHIIEAIKSE